MNNFWQYSCNIQTVTAGCVVLSPDESRLLVTAYSLSCFSFSSTSCSKQAVFEEGATQGSNAQCEHADLLVWRCRCHGSTSSKKVESDVEQGARHLVGRYLCEVQASDLVGALSQVGRQSEARPNFGTGFSKQARSSRTSRSKAAATCARRALQFMPCF